jgi:hypothetical protein
MQMSIFSRMQAVRVFLSGFLAFAVVGCSGLSEEYASGLIRADPLTKRSEQHEQPIDLKEYRFDDSAGNGDATTAYARASGNPEDRNRLQDVLLESSDNACADFKDQMYARVAMRKVTLSTTALLSAGAAAIVGGDLAQKILAGVAASAVGYRVDSSSKRNVIKQT